MTFLDEEARKLRKSQIECAVFDGNVSQIRLLMAPERPGYALIIRAIRFGDARFESLKFLAESFDWQAYEAGWCKRHAINCAERHIAIEAASTRSPEILAILLDSGMAKIRSLGYLPLYHELGRAKKFSSGNRQDIERARACVKLIAPYCPLDAYYGEDRLTPLSNALKSDHWDMIAAIAEEMADRSPRETYELLTYSMSQGWPTEVLVHVFNSAIQQHGAETVLRYQHITGDTILHEAGRRDLIDFGRIVLESGPASVLKIKNASGDTPIDLAGKAGSPTIAAFFQAALARNGLQVIAKRSKLRQV